MFMLAKLFCYPLLCFIYILLYVLYSPTPTAKIKPSSNFQIILFLGACFPVPPDSSHVSRGNLAFVLSSLASTQTSRARDDTRPGRTHSSGCLYFCSGLLFGICKAFFVCEADLPAYLATTPSQSVSFIPSKFLAVSQLGR